MEQQIIEFIVEYKWYLTGGAILIALALVALHARARALVLRFLKDASVDTIDEAEKRMPVLVNYVYNKLPVRYRALITKSAIEKMIRKVILYVESLDKSNK